MKKTDISLLICTIFTAVLMCSCKFNLSNSKYLERPDVYIESDHFEISGAYISTQTKSITIYRQNVSDRDDAEIERVAILYPDGAEETDNQTFKHKDYMVLVNDEYRYYLRFTDNNGVRNRTEWSAPKKITSGGVSNEADLRYDTKNLKYTYDPDTMVIKLPTGQDFDAPSASVITDIAQYNAALVFQYDDVIQSFAIDDTTNVNLKALLPTDFLYKDIKLLGIVGQKTEYNSKDAQLKKCIKWTKLSPLSIVNAAGNSLTTIRLDPKYGKEGTDYSTVSDNEN
jgi:hypothetical protein